MRLDQWLWAVRVFKTRSRSAEAIKSTRVRVNGEPAKPARAVQVGEVVTARMDDGLLPWTRTLRVLGTPASRVGAKLVALHAEDLTPPEELAKREVRDPHLWPAGFRSAGTGRPTKRERRAIGRLEEESGEPNLLKEREIS